MNELLNFDSFIGLWQGLTVFFHSPLLFFLTFIGVVLGMIVGILPGFGPPAAMALLFPITYKLDILPALALLSGLFYGAKYGGAITSLLVGIPGETDAIATLFDGYPLTKAGKATKALRVSLFSSFFGATFAFIGLLLLAPVLTYIALALSPFGRFLLLCGALILIVFLTPGIKYKHALMTCAGMALASVGMDSIHGTMRMTFNSTLFFEGIPLTPLLLGLFGIADILDTLVSQDEQNTLTKNLEQNTIKNNTLDLGEPKVKKLFFPALRSSLIGFLTGLVPSGAGMTASFAAYALEKKIDTKNCKKEGKTSLFGKGAWAGLVAPESANNAAAMASFAPLLLLGLPTNAVMATLLGALTIGGIVPGPNLVQSQSNLYWGFMASMAVGNICLLFLGLYFSSFWAKVARIPYTTLYPLIFILCVTGSVLDTGSISSGVLCVFIGFVGFILRRYGFAAAPFLMGFILGGKLELHFIQTLMSW